MQDKRTRNPSLKYPYSYNPSPLLQSQLRTREIREKKRRTPFQSVRFRALRKENDRHRQRHRSHNDCAPPTTHDTTGRTLGSVAKKRTGYRASDATA